MQPALPLPLPAAPAAITGSALTAASRAAPAGATPQASAGAATARSTPAAAAIASRRLVAGIAVGLVAASIGALYTVFARLGLQHGMAPADITFLRFAVAGVLLLPVAVLLALRQPEFLKRWRLWLAVSVLAGPPFGLLMFGALNFAPAAHAAVFPFASMSIMGTLGAWLFLGDRLTVRKLSGIAVVIAGLVVLSGIDASTLTPRALLGDAMFILAGTLWAGFGIVMRRHGLNPWHATVVIGSVALVTFVPLYLARNGVASLAAIGGGMLLLQALVQGVIAGIGTLFTYAKMVALLGPSRAAVFPALAPGLAALMAWPVLGHVPATAEVIGLALAMGGLVWTVTARAPAR